MRTAILLAAGESRRMGTLKPLLPFGSGSVIEQVVRSLQASPIDAVLVVVGHRGPEIAAHLRGLSSQSWGLPSRRDRANLAQHLQCWEPHGGDPQSQRDGRKRECRLDRCWA